jgi:uncharacterized protein
VYVSRRYLVPWIPDPVLQAGAVVVGKNEAILLLFALLMLAAAIAMLRETPVKEDSAARAVKPHYPLLTVLGAGVGLLTGVVGAGGGFLLLPVLVLVAGLPIKIAIGTDLLIIAAKSLVGFIGETQVAAAIDWHFVATITVLPAAGVLGGTLLNRRLSAARLKPAFGWFVLLVAIYIIARELIAG